MEDGAPGVGPAAHAGHQVVGVAPARLLQELGLDLLADDRLQPGHHIGIGVRAHGGTDDVEGVGGVAAPVADSLVGGVLERLVAGMDRDHGGAEHLHLLDVDPLAADVGLAHVHHAFHVHQRAHRGRGHAVLAGARLGDDAPLAHLPGHEDLPHRVVDLVGPGVVEVFALEPNLRAVALGQAPRPVQRARPPHVVAQQGAVLPPEAFALEDGQIGPLQVFHAFVQDFGDVRASEFAVITF